MALNLIKFKSDLKAALKRAQQKNQQDGVESDEALQNMADEMAAAIDSYLKTATVKVTAITGEIAVQGSPTAQANVAPITLTGNDPLHLGGLS